MPRFGTFKCDRNGNVVCTAVRPDRDARVFPPTKLRKHAVLLVPASALDDDEPERDNDARDSLPIGQYL